jgi:mono/diheme cytochrome c family protein
MNYPVWDVAFGAGLLMAVLSILHVFVSHFAVGGGLFLVLTEKKAYRQKDMALLGWLKTHTKFFVLVTVVFGAISGVGIWFTIGLINPSATSSLIHSYVWGWAIEWVFFFLEITAALLYMYGWEKMDRRLHLWYGWIYFVAAFASMVVINGIVSFMLTSGRWIETHNFWSGFFNPSFFPSLLFRFTLSLALAGIYALLTASLSRDADLKGRLTKWSSAWIIPPSIVLPFIGWWYIRAVPSELWASAQGPMPTATRYASVIIILAAITFVLSLLTLLKPRRLHLAHALLITLSALATMGAFEFIREAVRKPYVIAGYMYGNSLFVTPGPGDSGFTIENIDQAGILSTAKWIEHRNLAETASLAAGKDIFRVECQSCHTRERYRGLKQYLDLRKWDEETVREMLSSLDLMHNGVMPPFTGKKSELDALAAFLTDIRSKAAGPGIAPGGRSVFDRYCVPCHQLRLQDALFTRLRTMDPVSADAALQDLKAMFIRMPGIRLTSQDRAALVQWIRNEAFSSR